MTPSYNVSKRPRSKHDYQALDQPRAMKPRARACPEKPCPNRELYDRPERSRRYDPKPTSRHRHQHYAPDKASYYRPRDHHRTSRDSRRQSGGYSDDSSSTYSCRTVHQERARPSWECIQERRSSCNSDSTEHDVFVRPVCYTSSGPAQCRQINVRPQSDVVNFLEYEEASSGLSDSESENSLDQSLTDESTDNEDRRFLEALDFSDDEASMV